MAHGSNGSKVTAAMFALTATFVAALTGMFLLIQSFFPWMTVFNQKHAAASTTSASRVRTVVDVTHGGPTPAETVLKQTMTIRVPTLRTDGWTEVRASGGVPGVSFGFGCDPNDGLAPVVAESRSWVQTRTDPDTSVEQAVGTLDVSALAYPAGGGSVAFTDLTEAAARCGTASVTTGSGVGVEAAQVLTLKSASLVWRRGDVIMVGTATASGHTGSVTSFTEVFRSFDAALEEGLSSACLNQDSGVEDARRSPYLNRKEFSGNSQTIQIRRVPSAGEVTAKEQTTDPVVPIPGAHIAVPYVPSLPATPVPAVTSGPTALPEPVSVPSEPTAPTATAHDSIGVQRKIADPQGPGCGWAFTGQTAPAFDEASAQGDYEKAVSAAQRTMTITWGKWQQAKVAYYREYAAYVEAATRYKTYAEQVATVSRAWSAVAKARDVYETALGTYNDALASVARWKQDRATARLTYAQEQQACGQQTLPSPSEPPASSPSLSASSTSTPDPSDAVSPTVAPTPLEPTVVCPPVRPSVLDAKKPKVPVSPVPAPEAQLPAAKPSTVLRNTTN